MAHVKDLDLDPTWVPTVGSKMLRLINLKSFIKSCKTSKLVKSSSWLLKLRNTGYRCLWSKVAYFIILFSRKLFVCYCFSEEYYSGGYYASPEDAYTYSAHALPSSPYRNGEESSRANQMYRNQETSCSNLLKFCKLQNELLAMNLVPVLVPVPVCWILNRYLRDTVTYVQVIGKPKNLPNISNFSYSDRSFYIN